MPDLLATISYTGGFVALNVFSTIFGMTNLLPLQMLAGKKASKDGVKCFCEGHYYCWGTYLGVRNGDQCDAFTCILLLPVMFGAWVPMTLFQVWNVMGSIYWSLNMGAIVSQLQVGAVADLNNVEPYPNMTGVLFGMSSFQLLNAMFRLSYIVMPNVPGDGNAFVVMYGVWAFLCIIHCAITVQRAQRFKANRTHQYMIDLWTAHDWHVKKRPAWGKEELHPQGFDPLTMGPLDSLKAMRDASPTSPLETAKDIEAHIEAFLDDNTYPFHIWLSLLVVWFVILYGAPIVVGAIM